jgi:hypothetical protein
MAINTVPNASNQHDDVRVILRRTERFAAEITGFDVFIDGERLSIPFESERTVPLFVADALQSAGLNLTVTHQQHRSAVATRPSVVISPARELRVTRSLPPGCIVGGAFASSF